MISGIVLAAGTSARMGTPKQLLLYQGRPLLQHVIDGAEGAGLHELIVVLGHAASEIREVLEMPSHARVVVSTAYRTGQASSLRLGLESASVEARAAMVFLGDQPNLKMEAILSVMDRYGETGGPVVRAVYRGRPGHPVLLDRSIWGDLTDPSGDRGAGPTLAQRPEWVVPAPIDLPEPMEVDTPADFQALIENDGEPN